jgi:hypothetical protein
MYQVAHKVIDLDELSTDTRSRGDAEGQAMCDLINESIEDGTHQFLTFFDVDGPPRERVFVFMVDNSLRK